MNATLCMRRCPVQIGWSLLVLCAGFGLARPPAALAGAPLETITNQLGERGGVLVTVGNDPAVSIELARQTGCLVYHQVTDRDALATVRSAVDEAGYYGTRVFVSLGSPTRVHLANNVADALVASENLPGLSNQEVLRVLRPEGRGWVGSRQLTKHNLPGVDDWSHPYHGPDNNPASSDEVARGPYLTQFLAEPRYAPLPQLAVASAGRVFKLFGHIAFKEREEPWLNTMAAFNGYNGALLWQRPIPESLMVHRNVLVATRTRLYFGDDQSCKVLEPSTGRLLDEIIPPRAVVRDTFWKWMALEDGVLFALIGAQEKRDPVVRLRRNLHGWPWDPLSPGFNAQEFTWGFGRTVVAIDAKSKKLLWHHREEAPIDSRAMCMRNGRLFIFRFGAYLACLDTKTGEELWRSTPDTAPEFFSAVGEYSNRQDWRTNWRTAAYVKCSDEALYLSGPQVGKLLAISVEDGRVLWVHPYDNYQTVLLEDGLYGLSGQIDQEVSRKFDPLTGEVLAEIKLGRRACSRPTGALDAVFCRANGGSTRLELSSSRPQLMSPMRAQCHDGVTIANGLLYWWPSVCDCNLTLYGITSLGPAADFEFSPQATTLDRRDPKVLGPVSVAPTRITPGDWPTFRANNQATATTGAEVSQRVSQLWMTQLAEGDVLTAPTAVGDLVYFAGVDGVVRAVRAGTGALAWRAYTGGAIRLPPTVWQGRALVGSGDGWVYCFDATSGRQLWRFLAAPEERRIPVYDRLLSTWPVASGVLVQDGVAYVAAGIVNYDGTHVYALDAASGDLIWQNSDSGHLDPVARSGVSVQGHLLGHGGKLYLAGGNAVSPAVYDMKDGRCLSDPGLLEQTQNNNVPASVSPRGWELYKIGDRVMVSGKPYYAHPEYGVYDNLVFNKMLVTSVGQLDLLWVNNARLLAYAAAPGQRQERYLAGWGKLDVPGLRSDWERACEGSSALAVGKNAAVVASDKEIRALALEGGDELWRHELVAPPVQWGSIVDREGRVIVSLSNGAVLALGGEKESGI
jgi:outer membrane protein assembly factor BamB